MCLRPTTARMKSQAKNPSDPDPEDEILLVEDSAETSSPVLDAVVVAPHEYGAAQKDHAGEMIRKFEETFLEENVLPAQSL